MSITAKELAKKMGLSESAVSLALNGKAGVSTKTRQEVIEAASKYGYDFTRVTTKTRSSGTIYFSLFRKHGAVVADTPFFSELSEGIQEECKSFGYKLNINYIYADQDLEEQIEDIKYSDCIGLILLGTEMLKEDFKKFTSLTIPIVLLDAYISGFKYDCILINNEQGAYDATSFLISSTKKQPGYLHSSYSISNFEERADGFYKAVRANGMSASKSIVHMLSPSIDGAYSDMLDIIDTGEELATCYFADNDLIAIGAMKAFQKRGYKIPKDISIIGFDNLPMSSYLEPSLTTMNVPKRYMGMMATRRLISLLTDNHFVPIKLEVDTNIIIRKSLS